jgi:uncharacterized membrane protein (UPF0127 family)
MSNLGFSKRAAILVALFVSISAVIGGVLAYERWSAAQSEPSKATADEGRLELVTTSGVHVFDVEVAATPEKQALGLMFRTSLPDSKGMLFQHGTPHELTMWMRNTYIPLDMVFIRADGTVHRIEARTEPLSERIIASEGPVTAVLEIAGGAAERLGLKPGDKVRHPSFGTAPAR